jgi:hypothetical protein
MSQVRESSFHPSSPRSSSGGAESFQATPDTRLTAFSPQDGSVKSSRLLRNISTVGNDIQPISFPVTAYRGDASQRDKDPFITGSQTARNQQKLSPTASAFRPFAALSVRSPLYSLEDTPILHEHFETLTPSDFSTEFGLSRCLVISCGGKNLTAADFDLYLTVSSAI